MASSFERILSGLCCNVKSPSRESSLLAFQAFSRSTLIGNFLLFASSVPRLILKLIKLINQPNVNQYVTYFNNIAHLLVLCSVFYIIVFCI